VLVFGLVEHEGEEAHPPYTDETIKRAITQDAHHGIQTCVE